MQAGLATAASSSAMEGRLALGQERAGSLGAVLGYGTEAEQSRPECAAIDRVK
jgi:hypothetical protein